MTKLAIHGGNPVRTKPFPFYKTIGEEERRAVDRVLDEGILSKYLGCWHEHFMGGPQVRALEEEWADDFGVKHAIGVNSATSGLYCAVGAAGIEPGDEVIVTPYSMCSSATAPLVYGGIPVFADIEEDHFCLDAASIEQQITDRTKAILIVDLFGHPYHANVVNQIAKRQGLTVIEDAAQSIGGSYHGKPAGTLADIGVFSLNYHKHIHCGEGGVVVTNDDTLADRVRLIRNHAEAVVEGKGTEDLTNLVGFNYRLTELQAAIARCQLRKLSGLLEPRWENARYLAERLSKIPPISAASEREGCVSALYVQPFKFDGARSPVSRNRFLDAVRAELAVVEKREAEGVLISSGYCKPLYLQPMFQKKIAWGRRGFPFQSPFNSREIDYPKGLCPTCERMHEEELFFHDLFSPAMGQGDLDDVVRAFEKVWEHRAVLAEPTETKAA